MVLKIWKWQYKVNNDTVQYVLQVFIYIHAVAQHTHMHEWISQFTMIQILQSEYHLNG